MKKIFLAIVFLCFVSLSAFADDKAEALKFFNDYVTAANSYSTAIPTLYSPSAKIIRQVVVVLI